MFRRLPLFALQSKAACPSGATGPRCRQQRAMTQLPPSMKDIVIPSRGAHKATVIFMHGLGDTGSGWEDVAAQLNAAMPEVKFVLPTAPTMRVTLNMGMQMPAWYDIVGLGARSNETCDGIEESRKRIIGLLEAEKDTPKVFLCGFSQGGALALYTGLQYSGPLAGIAGLSSYLPCPQQLTGKTESKKDVPILMCHGNFDQVVQPEWAQASREHLESLKHTVAFHEFPMGHELHPKELQVFATWIKTHVSSA